MTTSPEEWPFRQLVQRVEPGARLLRTWKPAGGVSAEVTGLEIERADGETRRLIVRRHGERDRARNPHIAADEFRLLQQLTVAGIAVPAPCYLDESGEIFSTPLIVIEFVDGETIFEPADVDDFIEQLTAQLVQIHRLDAAELAFLPQHGVGFGPPPPVLDDSLSEGRIRAALTARGPVTPRNDHVLLHGDYWPGNLLWRDGHLVAILDWEDAAIGDPLADVANTRLEILWACGPAAMERFTERYRSMTAVDLTDLPYWDLCAALHPAGRLSTWGLPPTVEQRMRAHHRDFVERAMGVMRNS
jgi:aminoglycoside phosphotransferase (APT) family kinase protein